MSWLTPNSLSGSTSLLLTVPDDVLLRAAVVGSLTPLVQVSNWEDYGSQSAADTAAAMAAIIDQLTWGASAPAGGNVEFSEVESDSNTSLSTSWTTVNMGTVNYDPSGWWDDSNLYFVAPADGIYQAIVSGVMTGSDLRLWLGIRINGGTPIVVGGGESAFSGTGGPCNGVKTFLLSADDTIEFMAMASGNTTLISGGTMPTLIQLVQLG